MYHSFESIKDLHVEITNNCNAACPMCSRNDFGGKTTKGLVLDEWSRDDVKKIFDPRLRNLENVMFCGTHGDPATAKNTMFALNFLKKHFDVTIEFYSNGSVQSENWWSELGTMLQEKKPHHSHYRKNDLVIFSIDGLSDTNALYRRKTNFNKIISNAKAFIKSGGIARWDFIVFKHNEHQVQEAKELAQSLGFKQFRIRKTSRFDYSPASKNYWPVKDINNNIEYHLEPPSEQYRNQESDVLTNLIDKYGSEVNYFNAAKINCLYKQKFQRIYINAYASVFPCCFISNDIYPSQNSIANDTHEKVFAIYGQDFNSLRHYDWEEILYHEWFHSQLENSWSKNLKNGKLMRCSRTCGDEYNPIKSQSFDYILR